MIALFCDAGPETDGKPRKTTLFINPEGYIEKARVGWPNPSETGFTWGPILKVSAEEYMFQVNLATGTGA